MASAAWKGFINSKDGSSALPRYPILRYALGDSFPTQSLKNLGFFVGDANMSELSILNTKPACAAPQSYEDAIALTAFVGEFVAMLQRGFKVFSRVVS